MSYDLHVWVKRDATEACSVCGEIKKRKNAEEICVGVINQAANSEAAKPDWSAGDIILACPDGTIVLDDGITTWNPLRAREFLECKWCKEGEPEWSKEAKCWIHRRPQLDKRCLRRIEPPQELL